MKLLDFIYENQPTFFQNVDFNGVLYSLEDGGYDNIQNYPELLDRINMNDAILIRSHFNNIIGYYVLLQFDTIETVIKHHKSYHYSFPINISIFENYIRSKKIEEFLS